VAHPRRVAVYGVLCILSIAIRQHSADTPHHTPWEVRASHTDTLHTIHNKSVSTHALGPWHGPHLSHCKRTSMHTHTVGTRLRRRQRQHSHGVGSHRAACARSITATSACGTWRCSIAQQIYLLHDDPADQPSRLILSRPARALAKSVGRSTWRRGVQGGERAIYCALCCTG